MQDYATMIKEGTKHETCKDTRISVLLNPRRKIKASSPQTRSVISISASISTSEGGYLEEAAHGSSARGELGA